MSRDLLSVERGETITSVAERMVERNIGACSYSTAGGSSGIMTERDLMRAVARGLHGDAVVADYMTTAPETIEPRIRRSTLPF